MGLLATSPLPSRGPQRFRARDKNGSGPQMGKLATSPLPSSTSQKYPDEVGGNIPSNVPEMYAVPGKMGGNGGKWEEKGCYGGGGGQITKSVGLGWTGLVSPFSPIFPHFSLGAFANAPPPPIALSPIKTMFFDLFCPQIPHFSIEHPKFPTVFCIFPHFPPFSPIFPWELSPMHPPHSLVANQNHAF